MPPELSSILSYMLRPSHGLLLLALIGWLWWHYRGSFRGRRMMQGALVMLGLIILTPLPQFAISPLENRFPVPGHPENVSGIILLTGGEKAALSLARSDLLYSDAGERVMLAARLAHLYPDARILVTGAGGHELAQADISAKLLRDIGIDAGRIVVEKEARNTHENATLSFEHIGPGASETWLLVTSAYHMPRAVGVFRKAGWSVTPWPTDFRTTGDTFKMFWSLPSVVGGARTFDLAFHEWVGLLSYYFSGWSDELFPS